MTKVKIDEVTVKLNSIAQINSDLIESLQNNSLISNKSDEWLLENIIYNFNPIACFNLMQKDEEHFSERNDLLKSAFQLWFILGDKPVELRRSLSVLFAFYLPIQPFKNAISPQSCLYGIPFELFEDLSPEVVRIAFLSGRTRRPTLSEKSELRKRLNKRKSLIETALMIIRSLHAFVLKAGDECPELIARDALIKAIEGFDAREAGRISKEALAESKKLYPRQSRQTLFDAWTMYKNTIVIWYAISSIGEENEWSLFEFIFNYPLQGHDLFDYLKEITSRSLYIVEDVVSKFSEAEDWDTTLRRRKINKKRNRKSRINSTTMDILTASDAKPEKFAPHPLPDDIINSLKIHYHLPPSKLK